MVIHTCDICGQRSDTDEDVLLYGDWMQKQNITVHYFCLLLTTDLPQRGGDSSGILGFLLRDIRVAITNAKKRTCVFCYKTGASISCCKCQKAFHLSCSIENHVVSEFCHEFPSFCADCRPLDEYQLELLNNPPKPPPTCSICFKLILSFALHRVAYGDCCRKGFAHRTCMRRYALSAGYYLRCIWCRQKKFRDLIRLQSVFVPDRDATWEREEDAYKDLYTQHLICQQNTCLCCNGRSFNRGPWKILRCKLCGSTAAHAGCLPGGKAANITFKCETCSDVEGRLRNDSGNRSKIGSEHNLINSSFYMTKSSPISKENNLACDDDSAIITDDDDTVSTASSQITVVQLSSRTSNEVPGTFSSIQQDTPVIEIPDIPVIEILDTPVIEIPDTPAISFCPQQQLQHLLIPPHVLKESYFCYNQLYFYLVIYEYNNQTDRCMGTCTLRFHPDDERIKDFSVETLKHLELHEEDIWIRKSFESNKTV